MPDNKGCLVALLSSVKVLKESVSKIGTKSASGAKEKSLAELDSMERFL